MRLRSGLTSLSALMALAACTPESPRSDPPDAREVPGDFCDRLDLRTLLTGAGAEPVRSARSDDVDGGAVCVAVAPDLSVELQAVAFGDAPDVDRAWRSAISAVTEPTIWRSLGPVKLTTPARAEGWDREESGMWVGRERGREGAVRVLWASALGDADVVVRLTVSSTAAGADGDRLVRTVPALATSVIDAARTILAP